jgi:adenine C2-methylase RlmN of 23S rRNA A2503 and tRNA A37
LILLNPVAVLPYERPGSERIERFAQLGIDISAASGQLATEHQESRELSVVTRHSMGCR